MRNPDRTKPACLLPTRRWAVAIAAGYALIGALWIFSSGWLLHSLVQDEALSDLLENVKGWFYVGVTATLLFLVLNRYFREIRRSAIQLQDSEARLRLISDTLPNSYVYQYTRDADGAMYFEYLSAGVERVHGFSPEDAIADPNLLFAQSEPEQLAMREEAEAESQRNLTEFTKEMHIRRADGQRRVISLHSQPRHGLNGRIHWTGLAVDITATKEAESARAESDRQYRELVQNANSAILRWRRDGTIAFFNEWAQQFFGYTAAEAIGQPVGMLVPEQESTGRDLSDLIEDIVARPERFASTMNENVCKDGRRVWISWTNKALRDEAGEVVEILAIGSDITGLKLAEEALRESEAQFRAVFEMASVGMAQADPQTGQLLRVNQRLCEMTGYTREELLQRRVPEITHPDDRDQDAALFQSVVRGERSEYRLEKRYLRKDGGAIWGNVNMTVIRDTEGRPVRTVATIEDISERKRALEELRKLSAAITQSPVSVVITGLKGDIEYVNPRFTEITGYSFEEMQGKNSRILKSGETSREDYAAMWRTITAGGAWRGEFHNKKKDGSLYWERALIAPIRDANGSITHFVAIKEDITQQKILEEQYRQAQKMEAIGQLAGGVAHDFNNILQAMVGYTQMLLDRIPKQDAMHEFVEEIRLGAERAAALTRQLLAFSRRQILEVRDLNIDDVVNNLSKMIRRLIGEHIELHIVPKIDLWNVRADLGQIEQVLLNLCVNARDAMPEGGKLTIEAGNLVIDEEFAARHSWAKPGEYVIVSVSDTGQGMSPETVEHVFEPFFTTKELGKGTGLGLATVYGIVQQHGGMIQVYSETGCGTSFKVYLPAVPAANPTTAAPEEKPVAGGTETILVVEDDEAVRKATVYVLENAGYTVRHAGNGHEALQALEQAGAQGGPRFDLILTDLVMPKLGGQGLYEKLKNEPGAPRFLFSSGYTLNAMHTGFVLDEGIDLLQKPYTVEDLLLRVRQVLDKR